MRPNTAISTSTSMNQGQVISLVLTCNEIAAARGSAKNMACEQSPAHIHHQFPSAHVLIGFSRSNRRGDTHYLETQCVAVDDAVHNDADVGGVGSQLTRNLSAGLLKYQLQKRLSPLCMPNSCEIHQNGGDHGRPFFYVAYERFPILSHPEYPAHRIFGRRDWSS